jgi:hypothetical protein
VSPPLGPKGWISGHQVFTIALVVAVLVASVGVLVYLRYSELPVQTGGMTCGICPYSCIGVTMGLASPSGNSAYPAIASSGASFWYNYSYNFCGGSITGPVSALELGVVTPGCVVAHNLTEVVMVDGTSGAIAFNQNGSTGWWSGSLSTPISPSGQFSIVSSPAVTSDGLWIWLSTSQGRIPVYEGMLSAGPILPCGAIQP